MKKIILLLSILFPVCIMAQYGPGPSDKGKMYYEVNDFNKALEQFNEAISSGADIKGETYLYRGLTQMELGEYQAAIDDFNQVLKNEPEHMSALLNRGVAKSKLNDNNSALTDIKRVVKVEKNSDLAIQGYFQLGKIYYSQMEMEIAIENFTKVIELDPDNYEAYIFRGAALDIKLDFNTSIKDYTRAIQLSPENPEAYVNRGMARINILTGNGNLSPTEREVKTACDDLQTALKLGDGSVKETLDTYCK